MRPAVHHSASQARIKQGFSRLSWQSLILTGVVLLGSVLPGCAAISPHEVGLRDPRPAAAEAYQTASLSYFVPPPAAATAGWPVAANPPARGTTCLRIEYPHPQQKPGLALVEVVVAKPVSAAAAPQASPSVWTGLLRSGGDLAREHLPGIRLHPSVQEAWTMDLPRGDLDRVVADLKQAGFLSPTEGRAGDRLLKANLDGAGHEKPWSRLASLENLLIRVRQEGSLASSTRPFEEPGTILAASSSPLLARGTPLEGLEPTANPFGTSSFEPRPPATFGYPSTSDFAEAMPSVGLADERNLPADGAIRQVGWDARVERLPPVVSSRQAVGIRQ